MVKILIVVFLIIVTLTLGLKTRRYVKSGPLWLGDFKDVLSPNWKKNMRPLQKPKESIPVLDYHILNILSKPENEIKKIKESVFRKNSNILRMCSIKGCGKKKNESDEKTNTKSNENYNNEGKNKYKKKSKKKSSKKKHKKDVYDKKTMMDSSENYDSQEKKICPCAEGQKKKKICYCEALRTGPDSTKQYSCICSAFDYICKLRCQQRKDKIAVLKQKRCGCSRNDYTCLNECFNNDNTEPFQRYYLSLRSFLRCGCGKTDRMCQNRCFDRDEIPLRSFLLCGCQKTDRMCQDRCLNDDALALRSFLKCECAKNDRTCHEICFQSTTAEIRNRLRCGCNATEFSCLDRCARKGIQDLFSTFSNCGCNSNDYACKVRCERNANGWRKLDNRICKCENYDNDCKTRCARDKIKKNSFDSLIAHVASNGKIYKINNDTDVLVYDPLNLGRILNGIKFNNDKIRAKPVTKVDGNERTNKEKWQEVLKDLQEAKMVEFDIGNVQTTHNGKFRSAKPTKFMDKLLEFAKNKNATSIKLSHNVHVKANIVNKSTNKDSQKQASNFGNFSLEQPKNVHYPQKPNRDVERRNANQNRGMDFANDVIESLQDYLYSRRKSRQKRIKNDDYDLSHQHSKHRLLPLTKMQKKKKLNGQVGRSLIKFRRNSPGDKVVTYGAPFELDIKGMGQVNFMKAIQLLNV